MHPYTKPGLHHALRPLVPLWFLADALIALLPPLHWAVADGHASLAGIPASLVYFCATGAFIAASILFAYWVEAADASPADARPVTGFGAPH